MVGPDGTAAEDVMPAWRAGVLGEPAEVLAVAQVPVPVPGPGEVLVEVRAAALNFPDVLLCRGQYQERPPLPFTPGIELCGVVRAAGDGVGSAAGDGTAVAVGQRVIGPVVLPYGALARYALCRASDLHPAPPELDDACAAALHIAYQTAWFALHRRAGLRAGEWLLVNAAAGGVGSAAVQLGRAAGARVIGVVGGAGKVASAEQAGADVVIDRSTQDVVSRVKELTGGRGVDVVFDPVGGDSFAAATKVIGFEGRIVVIGFAGGTIAQAATNHLLVKNYSVVGLHWGLYRSKNPDLIRQAHDELRRLVSSGVVRPLIGERVGFTDAAQALARLAAGRTVGRVAVLPPA
ncbi:MAG TPA: NADPH:quinone oxidoreductase family protein [Kineosporiaceae bacterium]|nr:NADPH:quinone oxidoreductase family protein [Kineosporiaceae bacterium]